MLVEPVLKVEIELDEIGVVDRALEIVLNVFL
jgi:hypothetical protein